jgi:CRP-like cAMP-binding protein
MFKHVYSDSPWLIPPDCQELVALFRDKGRPISFSSRRSLHFGERRYAYLIEKGLVATYAGSIGKFERLIAIFQPGTVFGAEKSLKGEFASKPLIAKTLLPVQALMLDSTVFKSEIAADPVLAFKVMQSFLAHDDAKIEGLLMNDLLTVPQRVALMVDTIFKGSGHPLSEMKMCLPLSVNVTELSRLIHCDRSMLSRSLRNMAGEGLLEIRDGNYFFDRNVLKVLEDVKLVA